MKLPSLEIEGTWEEVATHAPEFAGRRVRLTVLQEDTAAPQVLSDEDLYAEHPLLRHLGTWQGDDFEECLAAATASRSRSILNRRPSMKFQDNLAWVIAMDEIQGDISDPSSFCPSDEDEQNPPTASRTARRGTAGLVMSASASPTEGNTDAGGSTHGNSGNGSVNC